MNTDKQIKSAMCLVETHDVSYGETSEFIATSIGVKWTCDLVKGALFIVSNGTDQDEDIPEKWWRTGDLLKCSFDGVKSLNVNSAYFFPGLIKAYADLYNINLHLIVYYNDKYILIDKNEFVQTNEEQYPDEEHAFIFCNADNTYYSPLYIDDVNGHRRTVFKIDETFPCKDVESFIDLKNQELLHAAQYQMAQVPIMHEEEDASHMAVDTTSPPANQPTSSVTHQHQNTLTGGTFIERTLQEIQQLSNILSPWINRILLASQVSDLDITNINQSTPQDIVHLIQQRLLYLTNMMGMTSEQISQNDGNTISMDIVTEDNNQRDNLGQSHEMGMVAHADQNPTSPQQSTPTILSDTTRLSTPVPFPCDAPQFSTEPKEKWCYRSMRDLGRRGMPLLAGEGPQRTPIQATIPPSSTQATHLGVKIVTNNDQEHRLKVPVPEGTKVDVTSFYKDNNLNRLQFHQRNTNNYFDQENRHVYLAIDPAEHTAGMKDIRIHMFNLYQSGTISRELIKTDQLGRCKLAIWLCRLEDEVYKPISPLSFSRVIEEE